MASRESPIDHLGAHLRRRRVGLALPGAGAGDRVDVDVWEVDALLDEATLEALAGGLDPEERSGAQGFRKARDRRLYLTARGATRAILATHLGTSPAALRFRTGEHGKPALDGPFAQAGLEFNVAHSGDLVLIAVATAHEVGVDLEWMGPDADVEEAAEVFLSPGEREAVRRLPEADRRRALFQVWVRKEATLKALGSGLSVPPAAIEVGTAPPGECRAIDLPAAIARTGRAVVTDLPCRDGYAAAVAALFAGGRAP